MRVRSLLVVSSLLVFSCSPAAPAGDGGTGGGSGGGASSTGGGTGGGGSASGGGGGAMDAGPVAAGFAAGPPPSPITGTARIHFLTEAGLSSVPLDYSLPGRSVGAFVPTDGGYRYVQASAVSAGSFVIEGVPEAPFFTTYNLVGAIETTRREVSIDEFVFGRPDVAPAAANTKLSFNLTNMTSFTQGDLVHLVSTGAGVSEFVNTGTKSTGSVTGGTTLALTIDVPALERPVLIDGAKGDALRLLHLGKRTLSNAQVFSVVSSYVAPSGTALTDGQARSLSGVFTRHTADQNLSLTFKGGDFEAQRTVAASNGVVLQQTVVLYAQEQGVDAGISTGGAPLLLVIPPAGPMDTTVAATWADALPGWGRFGRVDALFTSNVYAVGASVGLAMPLRLAQVVPESALASPIGPLLTPPRNLKVAGQSTVGGISGVGETPVLSWDAPATGTPSGYFVEAWRLRNTSGTTTRELVSWTATTQLQHRLLPGSLSAGETTVLIVRAVYRPGLPFDVSQLAETIPYAIAEAATGTVVP